MLNIFKLTLLLFIFTNLVWSENCSSEYKCTKQLVTGYNKTINKYALLAN